MEPHDFGLPHDEWRPHQYETIKWLQELDLREKTAIIDAPTGSGKTSYPAAYSKQEQVFALCRTKNLQAVNYEQYYGATVMYGKSEYECFHPLARTSEDCPYPFRRDCNQLKRCPQMVARVRAVEDDFVSLNYMYYLSNPWARLAKRKVVFCDEAHQLSDQICEFVSFSIKKGDCEKWELPDPPFISGIYNVLLRIEKPEKVALRWLSQAYIILAREEVKLKDCSWNNILSRNQIIRLKECQSILYKIAYLIKALEENEDAWFIRSGPGVIAGKFAGMVIKPLTAQFHFPSFFRYQKVLMSATIGDVETFTKELGIDSFEYQRVPNQFPPEVRPVHILSAPKLSRDSTSDDYDEQALVIAEAIKGCPSSWSGLLHITAKKEARPLADRLAANGLQDRIWIMPGSQGKGIPTKDQVAAWHRQLQKVPNSLCITWSLTEGYDGLDEKICISAKCPFPSLADDYEQARLQYSKKFYLQRTAWTLEQSLGRTRRGRECDYDFGERRGFVAIADGNYYRAKSYLTDDMREALVDYD